MSRNENPEEGSLLGHPGTGTSTPDQRTVHARKIRAIQTRCPSTCTIVETNRRLPDIACCHGHGPVRHAGWQRRRDSVWSPLLIIVLLVLCNMVVSCSVIECASRYTKGSGIGFFQVSARSCKTSFVGLSDSAPEYRRFSVGTQQVGSSLWKALSVWSASSRGGTS